jgi:hypothetical protein
MYSRFVAEFPDGFSIRVDEVNCKEVKYLRKSEGWDRRKIEQVMELLSNPQLTGAVRATMAQPKIIGSYEFKL